MGFFKDLKNKVTGGAAVVSVNVPTAQRGRPANVQVQATAKANGKVSAVYLLVRAVEVYEFRDRENEKVRGEKISYENKITIAPAQDIKDGESYSWQGVIELPTSTNPTFRGSVINHRWELQAGLDMPGNDPDSGWQAFEVQ